jgi:hypothetical protein
MGQLDAERAFYTAFNTLGYAYVSWPNGPEINTPSVPIPADTLWYELDTLYGSANAAGAAIAPIRYIGLFQVRIHAPVKDSFGNAFGTSAIGSAAEAISTAFKLGTSIPYPVSNPVVYVHCNEPSIAHLGKIVPEWYTVVVRIPFRLDN